MLYLIFRCTLLGACSFLLFFPASAQVYYLDAFRYAYNPLPTGNARTMAMGGAQGALGGDGASLMVNPANIGMFRRSELSLTTALFNQQVNSLYLDNEEQANRSLMQLPHLSAVGYFPSFDGRSGFSIGISYVRTHPLHANTYYQAQNPFSTFADVWVEQARGVPATVFDQEFSSGTIADLASLAYATFVINPYIDDNTEYYTEFRDIDGNLVAPINQNERIRERGYRSSFAISFGGNAQDKIYWGLNIGLENIRYTRDNTYQEELSITAAPDELQRFTLNQRYTASGSGINLAAGVIIRLIEPLRIGLAAQTPTIFTVTERSEAFMQAESVGFQAVNATMLPFEYEFGYNSPYRLHGSLLWQIQKYGFIMVDFDWLGYRGMRVRGDASFNEAIERQAIRSNFNNSWQVRLGGEARLQQWLLRGGVCYTPSPIRNNSSFYQGIALTGGMGYRLSGFQLSLALVHGIHQGLFQPYLSETYFSPTVEQRYRSLQALLTTSWYF